MSRSRTLKPGFFKNEELAELGPYHQLAYEGLWILADREGRLEDRPKRIKIEIFPYYEVDMGKVLQELHDYNFIIRYEIEGNNYIWIPKFRDHQNPHPKEAKSTITAFNSQAVKLNCNQVASNGISETSNAGSSGSSITSIPSLSINTATTIQRDHREIEPETVPPKTVVVVDDFETNLKKLDELRFDITKKFVNTPIEMKAMKEMLSLLPIDELVALIKKEHEIYKPKFEGDKISGIQYFLPIVKTQAATNEASRASPNVIKEFKPKPTKTPKAVNEFWDNIVQTEARDG